MSQIDKRKILIVDDEPNVRQLVRRMLNRKFIVLEAEDGNQAIDIACTQKPDLILMDIMMPKMDGYTACREIKSDKATRAIPVVMLTSVDFQLNKDLAKDIGADGYITKPLDSQKLLDVMHRFKTIS